MDTGKTRQPKTGNNDIAQERPDFEKAAIEKFISDVTDPRSREQFESRLRNSCKFGYDLSRKRIEELETALNKINAIRNSIVGMQGFNFSEHAYPLVAALKEAGIKGMEFPEARKNFGTMLERTNKAEKRIEELESQVEDLKKRVPSICANTLHNDQVKKDGYCHLCKSNLLK